MTTTRILERSTTYTRKLYSAVTTLERNLMNMHVSSIGYIIKGNNLLQNIEVGDMIVDAKVTDSVENLVLSK